MDYELDRIKLGLTAPAAPPRRMLFAVVDCDGFGEIYTERDAETFNGGSLSHKPYHVMRLQEVAA